LERVVLKQILKTKEPISLTNYRVLLELDKNSWTISNLKKYKHKNSKGKYRPYCEMIVYFLTKKLKQKGVTP